MSKLWLCAVDDGICCLCLVQHSKTPEAVPSSLTPDSLFVLENPRGHGAKAGMAKCFV